jgi:hypothetical protein
MTRRERLDNKVERRQEWADKAAERSTASFNRAHSLVANIPFGQPILVGHHSERAHRRVIDRMGTAMDKGCELSAKAEMHQSKAGNLQAALDRTIFSDDDNAIEAIEARIARHEAQREQMKRINSLYRKNDSVGLAELGINMETLKAKLIAAGPYFGKAPHMPYEMTNLGGRIQADKKRLQAIKAQQDMKQEAADTENGVMVKNHNNGYTSVTFAEKPDYSVISALKDAGFRWGSGHWFGQTEKIPGVVAMLASTA